ncbi:MauE/DoxX family redox-associated membrane protein [Kribbella sp. CA-293567]|uniref:MauE/DoxX family redox-associated membrane protein n=1 Tax=Kribbella sp. CA-293567 TaxID=3002436 RepID=UPI0022DE600C|nr:MauE/DoxX family redox-associated membrane protein [Kribbella sp. CA-293567]WBQ02408.1 DoxX family membrane protein [Kribbella sp. CA-293567]
MKVWYPWISLVARLALGGVLLVAGALKVTDPEAATQAVRAYELLPQGFDGIVGLLLPFLEIVIGILLIVGYGVRPAAVAAGVLMLLFIAAVASAWARGLAIDCGCFGGGGQVAPGETKYLQEILRDVGLVALAAWLFVKPFSKFALEAEPHTPTGVTAS